MRKQSLLILVAFICYSVSVFAFKEHHCVHDEKYMGPDQPDVKLTRFEKKMRQSVRLTDSPIRIHLDSSNLKSEGRERELILKIMNLSMDFLSKRLRVMSTRRNTVLPSHVRICRNANVPDAHRTTGFDGDLVIYVTAENSPAESFVAWANNCQRDPLNGRPIAGQVNWNTNQLEYEPENFEKLVDVAVHEIVHVLAFSSSRYESFRVAYGSNTVRPAGTVTKTITRNGRSKLAIITPKVLEVARAYFNCPTLDAVDLEDQGGSGSLSSHWERSMLHNEMMCASTLPDEAFSEFTLALLEDSGWYKADYSYAEQLYFGKGAGCQYFTSGCQAKDPVRNEWCTVGSPNSCTFSLKATGRCRQDNYADGCSFVSHFSNGRCEAPSTDVNVRGESFEKGSRCVVGNVIQDNYVPGNDRGLCLKYTCTNNGRVVRFHIKGGGDIVCDTPGKRVAAPASFDGSILCPDPTLYCNPMYVSCLNDCSQQGYCNNGFCECADGWGGEDCSIRGGRPPVRDSSSSQTVAAVVDPCQAVQCGANSVCKNGACECVAGHSGPNCNRDCPKNCSGRGTCSPQGVCSCNSGFRGTDCSEAVPQEILPGPPGSGRPCPGNCNNRGVCYDGRCLCLPDFTGEGCHISEPNVSGSCPDNCFSNLERGVCDTQFIDGNLVYSCVCKPGFSGPNCKNVLQNNSRGCRVNCGNKGTCRNGSCVCNTWFIGEDCSQDACYQDCTNKGTCIRRTSGRTVRYFCRCIDGTEGPFCH